MSENKEVTTAGGAVETSPSWEDQWSQRFHELLDEIDLSSGPTNALTARVSIHVADLRAVHAQQLDELHALLGTKGLQP